jgi:hypothetical protein
VCLGEPASPLLPDAAVLSLRLRVSSEAIRRELATHATRLEHVSRTALGKGLLRVLENQKTLEGEARLFKATVSNLLTQTAQWGSQYQSFCSDVEVCMGSEVPDACPAAACALV